METNKDKINLMIDWVILSHLVSEGTKLLNNRENETFKKEYEKLKNGYSKLKTMYKADISKQAGMIEQLVKERDALKENQTDLVNSLKMALEVQGTEGNYNFDNYMLGMYNAIEFCVSVLERREPTYRTVDTFLSDKKRADVVDRDVKLAQAMVLVQEWLQENGDVRTEVIINHEGVRVTKDDLFIPSDNVDQIN